MSKNFIIPVLTFVLGAGAGFLVAKKVLDKKYAVLVEEEIASVREAFERINARKQAQEEREDLEKPESTSENTYTPPIEPKTDPNGVLTRSSLDNDPYENAKRDYHKISEKKSPAVAKSKSKKLTAKIEKEVRDDAGKTEQDMLNETRVDRASPYVIDDIQYSEEYDHHDKVSLYYYRVDGVLTEENEELVDDIENLIGHEALKALDMQTNVWVRNEPLGIDYEIIALNSSYAEAVHGIPSNPVPGRVMTPRERYAERQKRRGTDDE